MEMQKQIDIKNKKAFYEFEFLEKFVAGIMLTGTEIKSIREGKAKLSDGWCYFAKGDLWVKNVNISIYEKGTHYNHEPLRPRKLLLKKKELTRLETKIKERGLTIIPFRLLITMVELVDELLNTHRIRRHTALHIQEPAHIAVRRCVYIK